MKLLLRKLANYMDKAANGGVIIVMAITALLTLFGSISTVNTKLEEYDDYHKHELDELHEYVRSLEWYIMTSPNSK